MNTDSAVRPTGGQSTLLKRRSERSPDGAAASQPVKVLLLIKCLGYGGAERLLVQMVRQSDRTRFEYEVAYVLKAENTMVPELEAAGVAVHCLGAKGNKDLAWTRRLRSLLQTGHYDIIHTHLPYAATLGRIVATTLPRRSRPAIVYTEHNMWNKMAVALKALNRATIGYDDRVLVVSEAARRSMPRALGRRATAVIHGIELHEVRAALPQRAQNRESVRAELGLREGELLALTVANLRREKAYDVLLPAARLVADRQVPVRFVAVGRGPLHEELRQQHAKLGLGERFLFLGPRADVVRLLTAADLFVLPSRQEGLPVALMEASCVGLPLLVTDVGEVPSLLSNEVNAMVVPPEDQAAIADAVVRLASDGDLRDKLAAASLDLAERFDVRRCVGEIESIYDELGPFARRVAA